MLSNEPPIVFQSPLYATLFWGGSLMFIGMVYLQIDVTLAAVIAGLSIFITRILAIHYNISLPRFRFKQYVEFRKNEASDNEWHLSLSASA